MHSALGIVARMWRDTQWLDEPSMRGEQSPTRQGNAHKEIFHYSSSLL